MNEPYAFDCSVMDWMPVESASTSAALKLLVDLKNRFFRTSLGLLSSQAYAADDRLSWEGFCQGFGYGSEFKLARAVPGVRLWPGID